MLAIDQKGVFKTVIDSMSMETLTQQGWKLVAVMDVEVPTPYTTFETVPRNDTPNVGYLNATQEVQRTQWLSVKSQSFLLCKDAEVIVALHAERRRTAFERVLDGEYDDSVEGVEAGDFPFEAPAVNITVDQAPSPP